MKFGFSKAGLCPNGIYTVRIAKCDYDKSSQKKTPFWNIVAEVTEGDWEGKKLYDSMWLTDGNMGRVQIFLRALTGDSWDEDQELDPVELGSELLGLEAQVMVGAEPFTDKQGNDRMKNTINGWYPADANIEFKPSPEPVEDVGEYFKNMQEVDEP